MHSLVPTTPPLGSLLAFIPRPSTPSTFQLFTTNANRFNLSFIHFALRAITDMTVQVSRTFDPFTFDHSNEAPVWTRGSLIRKRKYEFFSDNHQEVFSRISTRFRTIAVCRKARRYTQHCGVDERASTDPRTHAARDSRDAAGAGYSGWEGEGRIGKEFGIPQGLKDAAERSRDVPIGGAGDGGEDEVMDVPKTLSQQPLLPYNGLSGVEMREAAYKDFINSKMDHLLAIHLECFKRALDLELLVELLTQAFDAGTIQQMDQVEGVTILPEFLSWYVRYTGIDAPDGMNTFAQLKQWTTNSYPWRRSYREELKRLQEFQWWLLGEFLHRRHGFTSSLVWDKRWDEAISRDDLPDATTDCKERNSGFDVSEHVNRYKNYLGTDLFDSPALETLSRSANRIRRRRPPKSESRAEMGQTEASYDDGVDDEDDDVETQTNSANTEYHGLSYQSLCCRIFRNLCTSSQNDMLATQLEVFMAFSSPEQLHERLSKPLDKDSALEQDRVIGVQMLPELRSWFMDHFDLLIAAECTSYFQMKDAVDQYFPDMPYSDLGPDRGSYRHQYVLLEYIKNLQRFQWWIVGELYHCQNGTINPLIWSIWEGSAIERSTLFQITDFDHNDYVGSNIPWDSASNYLAPDTEDSNTMDIDMTDGESVYEDALSDLDTPPSEVADEDMIDVEPRMPEDRVEVEPTRVKSWSRGYWDTVMSHHDITTDF